MTWRRRRTARSGTLVSAPAWSPRSQNGRRRTYPLGKGLAPHGVIVGPDGAAWITDGGQNAIVRVDPISKEEKIWPLPASRAGANLNTAAFDGKGRIWLSYVRSSTKGAGSHILIVGVRHPSVDNLPINAKP